MVFDSGYSNLPRNITPKFNVPDIPAPDAIVNLSGATDLITQNPLCDKNLLKGVDGLAALSTAPSLPNVEDILGASGLNNIGELLDPEAMFSGIPTLTELPQMLGLPNIEEIDWAAEAKAPADDTLKALNIENPLADICNQISGAGADADDLLSSAVDAGLDTNPLRDINRQMPNIDVPKYTDIVDIPEVGDLF